MAICNAAPTRAVVVFDLAQIRRSLDSAEVGFHPRAALVAYRIVAVTGGVSFDRTTPVGGVLRHMQRDAVLATTGHEVGRIARAVGVGPLARRRWPSRRTRGTAGCMADAPLTAPGCAPTLRRCRPSANLPTKHHRADDGSGISTTPVSPASGRAPRCLVPSRIDVWEHD